jgi:hypothetical protein
MMRAHCPQALLLATLCFCAAPRAALAASDLPPVGRAVHEQTWSGESLLTTPQVLPLEWERRGFEPRWTVTGGTVILQRARPQQTLFVINPVTGENIIDPADFTFPFQAGPDVGLVRYGTWADVEVRYFGIHDWQAAQGPVFSPDGFTLPIPGFDPALMPLTIASWYSAELDSVEINLRRNILPRWSLLAGFRYLRSYERLSFFVGDSTLENGSKLAINANNDLYGLQIGTEGLLWDRGGRFRVEGALKAGVFANGARSSIGVNHIGTGGGGDPDVVNWFGEDQTAFAGDLNFVGVYQLNEHWALRGGYQLLWLAGVAVANEQIHRLDFANGDVGTNTTHGMFFHGALAGLEATW